MLRIIRKRSQMKEQGRLNRRSFLAGAAALGTVSLTHQAWSSPVMAAQSVARLPARKEIIIRNAYIMTMDSALGDLTGDIHLRNGEIVAIGTQLDAPTAETIDGQNMIVLPGLIDTHWHLWTALLRSMSGDTREQGYFPMTERLGKRYTPEDMYRAAQLATAEALYSGITTIHDFNHNARTIDYARASIRAIANAGIRARFSYGYYKDQASEEATDFDSIMRLHREMKDSQYGLISLGFAPREVSIYKNYHQDWETARKIGLPITVHASSSLDEAGEIDQLYKDGLLAKDVLIVHATVATSIEMRHLSKSNAAVSLTPFTEMRTGFGFPPIQELLSAGVLISLGIDTTALSGNADMFAIMKVIQNVGNAQAKSEFAFSPRRILEFATINGAQALGIDHQVGSLKPGKRADLIMVSTENLNLGVFTDPAHLLVEAAQPSNVDTAIVDGRILKRNGQLLAMNAKEIIREAKDSLRSVNFFLRT
ncbi:amidohydrolase family protein [Phormidium nigroviride]